MESTQTYIEVTFSDVDETKKEILIALLSDAGYEGFVEENNSLQAFIPSGLFKTNRPEQLLPDHFSNYTTIEIPPQNWNSVWESSFQPVVIAEKVLIRAEFHESIKNIPFEIVITPKMSFGTGHHATTSLMVEQILNFDLDKKTVLDFGTGTGILAILAEKCGAQKVLAIDYDSWSITNAQENVLNNNCEAIIIEQRDSISGTGKFNFVLANINKNVILDSRQELVQALENEGFLVLSGLLTTDLGDILAAFEPVLGSPKQVSEKNNWLCLTFKNERIED